MTLPQINISGITLYYNAKLMCLEAPPNGPGRAAMKKVATELGIEFKRADVISDAHGDRYCGLIRSRDEGKVLRAISEAHGDQEKHNKRARSAVNKMSLDMRLALAKSILEGVRRNIDNSYTDCGECGSPKYADWQSHLGHLQVESAIRKVSKAAEHIGLSNFHGRSRG